MLLHGGSVAYCMRHSYNDAIVTPFHNDRDY